MTVIAEYCSPEFVAVVDVEVTIVLASQMTAAARRHSRQLALAVLQCSSALILTVHRSRRVNSVMDVEKSISRHTVPSRMARCPETVRLISLRSGS